MTNRPLVYSSLMMKPAVRSAFAVVDGLLLFIALEGIFSAISVLGLGRSFDTPTPLFLTSYLVWALVAATAGGFLAGKVAHRKPVVHGIIMAIILLPLVFFNLHKGLNAFVLGLNLLTPVACILGAALNRVTSHTA